MKPTLVSYWQARPGVYYVFRHEGEPPFAKLVAPKINQTRNWQLTYRHPRSADPFGGEVNSVFTSHRMAELELLRAVNTSDGVQLGIET
jgi:hypothetical protein